MQRGYIKGERGYEGGWSGWSGFEGGEKGIFAVNRLRMALSEESYFHWFYL